MKASVIIPCFRDADRAIHAAIAVSEQDLPRSHSLEVIVVEDGSGDETAARLQEGLPAQARLCVLPVNSGRATARATGTTVAEGDVFVFLDCDCLPGSAGFLRHHLEALREGAVASIGPVRGYANDFWDHYQTQASAARARLHALGLSSSGSSQNLAVLRSAYFACGGFDPEYLHYGFEDRDLLERVARIGTVTWTEQAQVSHLDPISLTAVSAKMHAAGAHSAPIFRERFADSYRELGYAGIDVTLRPWLAPMAVIGRPLVPLLSRSFDWLEARHLVPWPIGRVIVKATSGLSFLVGTSNAARGTTAV